MLMWSPATSFFAVFATGATVVGIGKTNTAITWHSPEAWASAVVATVAILVHAPAASWAGTGVSVEVAYLLTVTGLGFCILIDGAVGSVIVYIGLYIDAVVHLQGTEPRVSCVAPQRSVCLHHPFYTIVAPSHRITHAATTTLQPCRILS